MTSGRWIGQPVRRREDLPLVTGHGAYVDDLPAADALVATFVRCPYGHARILKVDSAEAAGMAGVVGIWTAADLGLANRPLPAVAPSEHLVLTQRPLAEAVACFTGEPVAVVVARSRYEAEDAAELVQVEYEPLPAVTGPLAAARAGAPPVHAGIGNIAARIHQVVGEPGRYVDEASGLTVLRFQLVIHRGSAQPMETRGVLARAGDGPEQPLTVWTSTQRPHRVRDVLADTLDLPRAAVRVITPDVGGGFGVKGPVYPEEVVVAWLARHLDRPVKWIEDRREHFLASMHDRDQVHQVEVACTADGRVVALRDRIYHDSGAYLVFGPAVLGNTMGHIPGPYRVPNLELEGLAVYTNAVPTGPYRGAGRPQGCFLMERVMDRVARHQGLDPVEVRRRNLVTADQMPYETGIRVRNLPVRYDSGDYAAALDLAVSALDLDGWRRQQSAARAAGRALGIGVAVFNEGSGMGPFEGARVLVDESGTVRVYTGATPQGQGHHTVFAQICAEELGLDLAQVVVVTGDTGGIERGIGTFASRSTLLAGTAVGQAGRAVREHMLRLAAEELEAAPADLEVGAQGVGVRGAPGRILGLGELARIARRRGEPLEAERYFEPENDVWGYGAQAAVVEVDRETGSVTILRSVFVHDCGTVINPLTVEGQVHGGLAQGVAATLLERIVYDESGQLLTATFADYPIPSSLEVPETEVRHLHTRSPLNPYGIKGAGESGAMTVAPVIAQAVEDALHPLPIQVDRVPILPEDLWQLLQQEHI